MAQNNINIKEYSTVEKFLETKTAPNASRSNATIGDELRWSMQSVVYPIENASQMVAGVHGGWAQTSKDLSSYIGSLGEFESSLSRLGTIDEATEQIINMVQRVQHTIQRVNPTTLPQLNTTHLRYYVDQIGGMHPAVLQYIQDNDDQFPYFRQISEEVGTMHTIAADVNDTNLLGWCGSGAFEKDKFEVSSSMRRGSYNKMFPEIAAIFDQGDATVGCHAVRRMGNNSFGKVFDDHHPTITSHGFNDATDVHHNARAGNARPKVRDKVISRFEDQVRMLDRYMPMRGVFTVENLVYSVPISGVATLVDQLGDKILAREDATDVLVAYDQERLKTKST